MGLPKTVLLTGGAGFIGSHFTKLLAREGWNVLVLDKLTYAGHRENLEGIPGEWQLIEGDIREGSRVRELLSQHRVRWIANLAAESHVDRSIESPGAFVETNVLGVTQMLSAALSYFETLTPTEKSEFRFLQVSTDEVFGALGETGAFSETTPIAPCSPYSASKAGGDLLALAWQHTFGLPVIVSHCSNNYGPNQFPEKLIPTIILQALAGKHLPVYGTGKNVRDWIHVEDHCAGLKLALEKGKPGERYCFGGRAERRNLEVVNLICSILDEERPRPDRKSYREAIQFVTDRKGHDWRYAIDDTKAERELGFKRAHSVEKGLRDTVHWYLENQKWCDTVVSTAKRRLAQ